MANDGLSAGAAARRLGVAVTTLRTWHQRYGLGPSRHEPGHHRRYTIEDMVRLQVMQRLTAQGISPAEAAAWARRSPALDTSEPSSLAKSSTPTPTSETERSPSVTGPDPENERSSSLGEPSVDGLVLPTVRGPAGGGRTIALGPHADPAARGLARAAMRLDSPAMRYILDAAVTGRGVIATWEHVMMPVLIGVGERYAATERFVEVEHLLSRSVTESLSGVPRPPRDITPRALLAAADEEQHTLPLEALAAALAESGVPSRLLGARLPSRALMDAVERTGPAVVVLWSQLPSTGDVTQLERLLTLPHPPLVLAAAGPGWPAPDLPPTVTAFRSLAEAVRTVTAACR
ncbi:MerR family transcriptional regulator [Actinoplanes derwentensis]|uniref:B12 binding domain-containing protein n=1 Tax=Actinoplanes derwentensis TaxID=113562 RepID=A0A1H2CRX3_9ACTN|nr:MerR family transcriptional regulator [Actinoplanes derwentensis]GID85432.1 transcriptional regulator [Actinoplanes derwentensis]SDT73079.1 B12 binding domain-containing protein [Actinoplanes derwentensis]